MATSSITKNFFIRGKEQVNAFIDLLEAEPGVSDFLCKWDRGISIFKGSASQKHKICYSPYDCQHIS